VQKGIEGSQTDPITVPRQFFGRFESKDRSFDGVIKDVETDQARVKIAVFKAVIDIAFPYRHSIASFSISGTRIPRQLTLLITEPSADQNCFLGDDEVIALNCVHAPQALSG
jgi:hypothetical protein